MNKKTWCFSCFAVVGLSAAIKKLALVHDKLKEKCTKDNK